MLGSQGIVVKCTAVTRSTQASSVNCLFFLYSHLQSSSIMGRENQTLTCGHSDHILKSINKLRKEEKLCDVTLKVGEKEFCAHRVVLSACSDYFCAMFTGDLEESHQSVVELQGLDSDTMEFLLDFVYTESIQVSVENVQALLPAACLLQLAGMYGLLYYSKHY